MSEELPLDEALQLEQRGYPLPGKSGVPVTRPTTAGLQWLAVPRDCVGLAYRIQGGTTLEAIAFAPDPHVRLRSLELTAPTVHLTCSADGRLVVAACIDGSLQCINATSTSLKLRWVIRNAHSHITQDISAAVSSSRDFAASKAGPIQSLAFAPSGYALLLADAGNQTLSIYDAESLNPVNLVQNQTQALCAAWSTETPINGEYLLAIGCADGSIDLMTFSMSSGDIENISTISALEDEDKEGFVCTYLDWFDSGKSLASGYCRVTPADNNDEQGEDDSAEHEAMLYVGPIRNYQDRTEVGDVVPFFSVPRNGRHVFFSSFCPSNRDTPLLFVASNVASEMGVVAPESGEWQVIDLQEGCGASTPTDEDDEFTFPMGIATVRLPDASSTSEALLLASTDGSLSVFHIMNQNNPEAFRTPQTSIVHGIACLPAEPLEMVDLSPPTPPLSPEPEEIGSAQESDTAQEATPVFGSGSASGLSFGSGAPSSLGSPAFGQPSALGVGRASSAPFSFAKPGASAPSAFGSPAFGRPSTLGLGGSSAFGSPVAPFGPPSTPAPFGGGGSAPIFGSATSSGGGFAALAASPTAGSGFGASLGPSPFDAFKSPADSVSSSMVMPLFGDSKRIQTSQIKETVEESTTTQATEIPPVIEQRLPELAEEPATFDEPGAKKAALVFDAIDENKTGIVPLEEFEAMLDELGEGFHGEELDAQRALIDPEGTNQIGRSAFVSWYVKLLAGDDGSGADGDNSSLDSEQEEERAKAEEVFASLATTVEGGKPAIARGDFSKLMEAMGTTYCEEEHRKTVKKLTKSDGMIYGGDFTAWYLDWLFGEGDSDEESVDSDESHDDAIAGEDAGAGDEDAGGWGNIFATSKDTWKCDSCMLRNDASVNICVACDTPKPGHAAPTGPALEPSLPSGASIGASGFTFGGAAPVAPASAQLSATSGLASTGAGGFTFGGASAPAAPALSSTLASIGAGGFTLGGGAAPAGVCFSGSSSFRKSDTKAASTSATADSCFSLDAAKVAAKNKEDTTESKAKASESSRYPQLSSKAPIPFGAAKTNAPASSKPAASFHPAMSSKAPIPYGGGNGSASGTTESSASSAYPLISSKAPTPFKAAKPSAPAPSKPAGSFYPPMSRKSPVPFGSGKASAIGSTKPSTSSVYPPISSEAPTPFGAAKTSTVAPSKPVGASYPPPASKAPTPLVTSSPEPVHQTTNILVPSGTRAPPSSSFPFLTPAASDYESQFRKVFVQFRASIALLADNRVLSDSLLSPADVGSDFEGKIEKLVEETELVRSACSDSHKQMTNQKDRSIFLLSRKTDIKRQTEDAHHLIDAHAVSVAKKSHIMQTQPLDAESERFRRRLAVKALMVTRDLERTENRISMLEGICDVRIDNVTGASIAVSSQDRKRVLFEALTSNFRRTQVFREGAAETASTLRSYVATIPSMVPPGAHSTALSLTHSPHTSISRRSSKHRLTPVPLRVSDRQLKSRSSSRQSSSEGWGKWAKIEIAMLTTKVKTVSPKKLTRLSRSSSSSAKSVSIEQGRRTATVKPSLFLSPAGTERAHRSVRDETARRELLIFSSPVSTPRSQWLVSSDTDQARVRAMSMKFPDRLKEVSATEAAREALAGFGTTPEKTERATALRNSARTTEPSRSRTPPKTPAEKTPRGSTSSAVFPPMSAKAPTPFSVNTTDKSSDAKGSYPYPPVAKQASQPFSIAPSTPPSTSAGKVRRTSTDAVSLQPKSSFLLKDDKKSSEKSAESAFGNLKGLGDSLFVEGIETSVRSEKSDYGVSGVNSGVRDATGGKPEPDYHTILTKFYKTHNPAKLIEVDKTLEKYQGREVEMFTKLARKYKVSSPLDSIASIANPSVSAPVIGAPMPSSSISSAFGSTPGLNSNITPSFGVSIPQSFPSSFGGAMTKSNPLAQPTFGEPPSTSTFGSRAPPASPSPFGRPLTQSTSSLDVAKQTVPLSAPSPFGPPATQSASSFGVAPQAAPPSSTPVLIGGREPRDVLVAFYQKYNPSKLNEVDKVLIKYKNNEEHLFRNLAKKYNLDPSLFGLPSNPQSSGFGLAGSGSTQSGFGQITPFGESATSGFSSSSGFGELVAAFGSPSGASTFGSPSAIGGHTFGSSTTMGMGGQPATFSSLATPGTSPSPFGGGTQTGGFGSMSGSGGFGGGFSGGGTTPFGAPRR